MSEKQIVAVDSQKLDALQNCMYFYNMKFVQNLVPVHTADYLERGGLLHHMLAVFYQMKRYRGRWQQNGKTYADVVASCIIAGRQYGSKTELPITEIERTIEVFTEYTDFWENDGWECVEFVEAVGSKILYDSDELCILYEVKIDLGLSIYHGTNRTVTPVDHKHSKARKDPNELANQFKGYCWFLGTNNIIINEVGFQKTVKPVEKFRRHTIQYSDALLSEWVENSVWWIRYGLGLIHEGQFPRNFTSCDKYAGCEFKVNVCGKDPEVREYKLRELYQVHTWDVGGQHL